MTAAAPNRRYRSTESKSKDGAHEMYVTYDLRKPAADKAPYTTKSSGYRRGRQGLEGGARSEEDGA